MAIEYHDTKIFSSAQLEELFLSVGWLSGRYPARLAQAMQGSQTVFTAWDGTKLVGLINALDDGELTAYIHYLLVHPQYHGRGIGKHLVEKMQTHYKGYLYLLLAAEDKGNIAFYQKLGFTAEEGTTILQIKTE